MPDTKPCDLPGCGALVRRGMLMCREHWYSVPLKLRNDVIRTWRAYQASCRPAIPFTEAVGRLAAYRAGATKSINGDFAEALGRLAAYRDARNAAIKAAREAIAL